MKTLAAIAAIAIALVLGHAVQAQTPTDPEGVFRAIVAAFNAGDARTSASYFSEDVTVTGLCPPANVCHGRAELQAQFEEEIANAAQDEIRSLTVDGDTIVVALTESVPGFAVLGIERVYINITATVQDGKITSMTDELDLSDSQTATFAQAVAEEEQGSLPATGTGYAPKAPRTEWWLLLALALIGTGAVAASLKLRTRA